MFTSNFIEGRDRIGIGAITRGSSDRTLNYGMIEDYKRCLQPVATICKTPRSTGSPTRVTATTRNGLQIESSVTNGGSVVTNTKTTNLKRQVKVVKG